MKPHASYIIDKWCCRMLFSCSIPPPKPRLKVRYWARDLRSVGYTESKVRMVDTDAFPGVKLPWDMLNSEQVVYGCLADFGSP